MASLPFSIENLELLLSVAAPRALASSRPVSTSRPASLRPQSLLPPGVSFAILRRTSGEAGASCLL
eukprot:286352-Hanusia_phi.AAC.1